VRDIEYGGEAAVSPRAPSALAAFLAELFSRRVPAASQRLARTPDEKKGRLAFNRR
jgi:hypothetical protein